MNDEKQFNEPVISFCLLETFLFIFFLFASRFNGHKQNMDEIYFFALTFCLFVSATCKLLLLYKMVVVFHFPCKEHCVFGSIFILFAWKLCSLWTFYVAGLIIICGTVCRYRNFSFCLLLTVESFQVHKMWPIYANVSCKWVCVYMCGCK